MTKITVFIPTYRRPKDLARCLEALKKQTRLPDEVLVTVRDTDVETWTFLESFNSAPLPLSPIKVTKPGVLEAHHAAYNAVQGDIIAITDDDAAPHPDWLERIEAHFLSDSTIGGVGGRDLVYQNGTELVEGTCNIVGKVQWFGRVIGNHHLGVGEPREVDLLKGVNSSYRRTAITGFRFDEHLEVSGTNTHYELALGLALKRGGWKLIYDPTIVVDHYQGQRIFMAQRREFNSVSLSKTVHNQTLILMEHLLPLQRLIFIVWAVLIGTRGAPGLVQSLRFLPREGGSVGHKFLASIRGRWQGWRSWKNTISKTSAEAIYKQKQ
jgi:cellulose synthase/poly-beta-1,6-N-acetylglucosamine synthase-like glycosyltransferase